ncbi:MAG: hypothetical protein H6711_28530 [Myxococcales bacterium]|nr:hypothetical protein [Myxococcales bacterium]
MKPTDKLLRCLLTAVLVTVSEQFLGEDAPAADPEPGGKADEKGPEQAKASTEGEKREPTKGAGGSNIGDPPPPKDPDLQAVIDRLGRPKVDPATRPAPPPIRLVAEPKSPTPMPRRSVLHVRDTKPLVPCVAKNALWEQTRERVDAAIAWALHGDPDDMSPDDDDVPGVAELEVVEDEVEAAEVSEAEIPAVEEPPAAEDIAPSETATLRRELDELRAHVDRHVEGALVDRLDAVTSLRRTVDLHDLAIEELQNEPTPRPRRIALARAEAGAPDQADPDDPIAELRRELFALKRYIHEHVPADLLMVDEALADLREQVDGHAQMLVAIRDGPPKSRASESDNVDAPDERDALDDDPADVDLDDQAEDDDDDDPDWCDPEQPFLYFHDAGGILLKNPRSTH